MMQLMLVQLRAERYTCYVGCTGCDNNVLRAGLTYVGNTINTINTIQIQLIDTYKYVCDWWLMGSTVKFSIIVDIKTYNFFK